MFFVPSGNDEFCGISVVHFCKIMQESLYKNKQADK